MKRRLIAAPILATLSLASSARLTAAGPPPAATAPPPAATPPPPSPTPPPSAPTPPPSAPSPPPSAPNPPPAAPTPQPPDPAAPAPEPPAPAPPPPAPPPALRPSPGPVSDPTPGTYPPLDAAGARQHEGFFFRALIGPSSLGAQTGSRRLSGGGFTLGLAAGHSLRRDLILQLDYLASYSSAPTYEVDGKEMDRDISALAHGVGPAVTWYTVHDIYASGGFHASWLSRTETRELPPDPANPFAPTETETIEDRSKTGIGASVTLGKEWWINDSWGLGLAARAYLASMPDSDSADSTWGVHSLSLLFSATLN